VARAFKTSTLLSFHRRPGSAQVSSVVFTKAANGEALCRMFKQAIRGVNAVPRYLSSDHDPLYRFHQWEANLRILGVTEIKTVPYVPWSHPFIERLIGTIRRECLDRLLFWTATDLELKLLSFRDYYNRYRTHSAREGQTPIKNPGSKRAELKL